MALSEVIKALSAYLLCLFASPWQAIREKPFHRIKGHNALCGAHGAVDESAGAIDKPNPEITQVFRFMDLPKEIRLLVYEQCDIQRRHYDLATDRDKKRLDRSCAALIVCSLPAIKLLQTCTTIHDEARPIFQRNQFERLISEPTRLFIRGSCALNYTAYLMDILLLMAGFRIDSVIAPQYLNLSRWLHARSWGPGALPPTHPLQQLLHGSPRNEHTRLITCLDFGVPPADANFWNAAFQINCIETFKLCYHLPWDEELYLRATGMVDVDLRLQSLSDTPNRSTPIGDPFHDAVMHNPPRHYATFSVGDFVELEEWQRDWVEID